MVRRFDRILTLDNSIYETHQLNLCINYEHCWASEIRHDMLLCTGVATRNYNLSYLLLNPLPCMLDLQFWACAFFALPIRDRATVCETSSLSSPTLPILVCLQLVV